MKKEKKKFKAIIISYVLALVCITSWVVFGVTLALTSVNIDVNGDISFTANDVYADVTGTVTGTATTNTLTDIHLTADTTSFTTPSSWSNITFDFVEGQDIVFTINVTNKSAERSLWVSFTDSISATNTDITRKSAGATVTAFSALEVPESTTKSVEITLRIKDKNQSVSGKFNLGLKLSNEQPTLDESNYSTLSFAYNDSAKTATVSGNSSNNPTGNLVIPSSVLHNGEEYIITALGDSAFYDCSSLTSITIPEGVTSIGSGAFSNCSKLTSVTFENTSGWKAGDTTLSSSVLANKSTAATFLTSTYVSSAWTRS